MATTRREFILQALAGTAAASAIPLLAVTSISLREYEPTEADVKGSSLHGPPVRGDMWFDTRPPPEGQKLYVYLGGNEGWQEVDPDRRAL